MVFLVTPVEGIKINALSAVLPVKSKSHPKMKKNDDVISIKKKKKTLSRHISQSIHECAIASPILTQTLENQNYKSLYP